MRLTDLRNPKTKSDKQEIQQEYKNITVSELKQITHLTVRNILAFTGFDHPEQFIL